MEYYHLLVVLLPVILILLRTRQSKLPPGPKPWPIIGNIHQLGDKPHRSVAELSKIYGPIMSLKLGSITTIVISSSELAEEMFVKHDLALSSRKVPDAGRVVNHDTYSVGWLPVCPKWRNLRKALTIQLFTNKRLDATQDIRQKVVAELVDYAQDCCQRGRAINVGEAGFTSTVNILSNTILSIDLSSHVSSKSQDLRDLLLPFVEEGGKPNVSDIFPLIRGLDLQGVRKRTEVHFYKMMRIFEEIIDARLRDVSGSGDDVLANLLELVEQKELDLEDVTHMLADLFIAGTDTSSATLEWAMTELLRHPEKMSKAQTEIDQVLSKEGRSVQESDIPKLPYIQAIVKETLRLYPPAPFLLPHKAEKEVQFCGYLVPRNAQVWVNVWSICRDPSIWYNPDSFSPERFLEREIDGKGRDFEFIPFGEGRRICPGMPLAYRMVHLILANFLCYFNWKPSDGVSPANVNVDEKFGVVLQRAQPLQVVPLSR